MNDFYKYILLVLLFFNSSILAQSQLIDSTKYTWRTTDIYKNIDAWTADLTRFTNQQHFSDFKSFENSEDLIRFCQQFTAFLKDQNKLSTYIALRSDAEYDFDAAQYRNQLNQAQGVKFGKMGQLIDQMKADESKIKSYLPTAKVLVPYQQFILSIFETQPEINHEVSQVLNVVKSYSSFSSDYDLVNSLIQFPKVKLKSGKELQIDWNTDSRTSMKRDDRKTIYEAKLGERNKFTDLYASQFKNKIGYFSTLAAATSQDAINYILQDQKIPKAYYDTLIQVVNDNLDVHYRYLNFIRKLLKVDTLRSWDIEVVPQPEIVPQYSIEEGLDIIQASLAPFGKQYLSIVKEARENRWIDIHPKPSSWAHVQYADTHPYVSVVYDNSYTSVRSLGHELGHCIEYVLASQRKPYPTLFLPSLLMEVPSNVNESLINHYLVNRSDKPQLYILLQALFYLNGSLFSTAMNTEVDYILLKQANHPNGLTNDMIKSTYLDTRRKFFGEQQGISKISPLDAANIGHGWFIKDSSRLRWLTYTMGTFISANIKNGLISGRLSSEDYLSFITAGDQPVWDTLEKIGIDLSSRAAYQPIFDEITLLLDLAELSAKM